MLEGLRRYESKHRVGCLQVLTGNTPRFFAESERPEFETFLDHLPGPYFVVERDDAVLACGGWCFVSDATDARLTWGMVDAAVHRQGLGRALLRFRIAEALKSGASVVGLSTTQLVSGFFASEGFETVKKIPDGFGDGLDRVDMELRLASDV
jgi:GNAT superfamily N-acetyltransferase